MKPVVKGAAITSVVLTPPATRWAAACISSETGCSQETRW